MTHIWHLARWPLIAVGLPLAVVAEVSGGLCYAVGWLIERGDARWGANRNVGD